MRLQWPNAVYTCFLCIALIRANAQSLNPVWLNQADTPTDNFTQAVAADTLNNWIYAGGSAQALSNNLFTSWGYATTSFNNILPGGGLDGYLLKMNMSGQVMWAVSISGSGTDQVLDIAVGKDGNVYVVGFYSMGLTLGSIIGSSLTFPDDGSGPNTTDAFIACYNNNGQLQWAKREYSIGNEKYFGISAMCDGVVAIGTFTEGLNENIQGVNVSSNNDDEDVFITKYKYNSAPDWLIAGGSELADYDHSLLPQDSHYAITTWNDTLYFIAAFSGLNFKIDYSTNHAAHNTLQFVTSSELDYDYLLGSITSDGKINWLKRQEHSGDIAKGMGIAADCAGVYATALIAHEIQWEGNESDNYTINGTQDMYLARYNKSSGNGEWFKYLSTLSLHELERPSALLADRLGNVYLAATTSNTVNYDGNIISADASGTAFILVVDKAGNYQTHITTNTLFEDRALDLTLCAGSEIVYCGWSRGNLDANQSISNISSDGFISLLDNTPEVLGACCTIPLEFCLFPISTLLTPAGSCYANTPDYISAIQENLCNCVSYTQTPLAGSSLSIGTHTITLYANGAPICSGLLMVAETQSPALSNPGNQVLMLNDSCSASLGDYRPLFNATDNCTSSSSIILIQTPEPGTLVNGTGAIHLNVTAMDLSGNTDSEWITVVPVASNLPVFSSCPSDMNVSTNSDDEGNCNAAVSFNYPLATPACGSCYSSDSLSGYIYLGEFYNHKYFLSESFATYRAADSLSYQVGGHLVTIRSEAEDEFLQSVTSEVFWIGVTDEASEGTYKCTNGEPLIYNNWATGQPASTSGNEDYAVSNGTEAGAWYAKDMNSMYRYVLEFDCPGVYQTQGLPSGSDFPTGIHTITFIASDEYGNTANCSFNVTVVDNEDPQLTCPMDIITNAALGECNAMLNIPPAVFTDNCGVTTLTWSMTGATTGNSDSTGINFLGIANFNIGTTTVTYTVSDAAGNINTCSFLVVVSENIAPTISCPVSFTINNDEGSCNASVNIPNIVFSDNCEVTTLTWSMTGATEASSPSFGINQPGTQMCNTGVTIVTVHAYDSSNNFASCSFSITILDTQSPVNTVCMEDQTVYVDETCKAVLPDYRSFVHFTDNCTDAPTIAQFPPPGTLVRWNTQVFIEGKDNSNNSAYCNFLVNVIDTIAPQILNCPDDMAIENEPDSCGAYFNFNIESGDNCECPSGFLPGYSYIGTHNGHTYYISNTGYTWYEAYNEAIAQGGHLVTISDAAENDFLPSGGTYWIGLTDLAAEGNYQWITGESYSFSNWSTGQPDNLLDEDFACIHYAEPGKWHDRSNMEMNKFILEFDCDGSTVTTLAEYNLIGSSEGITLGEEIATDYFSPGSYLFAFAVADNSGNTDSCEFILTINDAQPPVIECPDNYIFFTSDLFNESENPCEWWLELTPPIVTDNCGLNSLTNDYTLTSDPSSHYPLGTTAITWVAVDDAGNSDTCIVYVTIVDNSPPEIYCAPHITGNNLQGTCNGIVTVPLPMVSNECEIWNVFNDYNGLSDASGVFPVGITEVIFTVSDEGGNSNSCVTTIEIFDMESPIIECPVSDTLYSDDACRALLPDYLSLLNIYDNCGQPLSYLLQLPEAGSEVNDGDIVTIEAMDAHGNDTTCTFSIHVMDLLMPLISCPDNISVAIGESADSVYVEVQDAMVVENCNYSLYTIIDGSPSTQATGFYSSGVHTVEYIATDNNGNSASCTFSITVYVGEYPQIECPQNITTTASINACDKYISVSAPMVTDDQAAPILAINNSPYAVSPTDASGLYPVGVHTVEWSATDEHGNTSTCIQIITVLDTQSPQIICNGDVYRNTSVGLCGANITNILPPAFSDNCAGAVLEVYVNGIPGLPTFFNVGTTALIWKVTDASGNQVTCQQNVIVLDNHAPSISCPQNISINLNDDACSASVSILPPSVSDNCAIASISHNSPFLSVSADSSGFYSGNFPIGNHSIKWVVYDIANRKDSCFQNVTVTDAVSPSIQCNGNVSVPASTNCEAWVTPGQPVVSDNCDIAMLTNNFTGTSDASSVYPVGVTEVIWTVSDNAGNTNSCTMSVEVLDVQPPIINCPMNLTIETNSTGCTAELDLLSPAATDNCSIEQIFNDHPSDIFEIGQTIVTWTALDIHGNISTCQQEVNVVDYMPPSFDCPQNLVVFTDGLNNSTYVNVPEFSPTDNCGIVQFHNNFTGTANASAIYPVGVTQVLWTAEDAAGNSHQCMQTIIVADTIISNVVCSHYQVNTELDLCGATVTTQLPLVEASGVFTYLNDYDNSSSPVTDFFETGVHYIQWIMVDSNGVMASCTDTITVTDVQAPEINCTDTIHATAGPGLCGAYVIIDQPIVNENCGYGIINTFNDFQVASDFYPIGITTFDWIAVDYSALFGICTQVVHVHQTADQELFCPSDQLVYAESNGNYSLPDYTTEATFTSDCPFVISQVPYQGTIIQSDVTVTLYAEVMGVVVDSCSFLVQIANEGETTFACPDTTIVLYADSACHAHFEDYTGLIDLTQVVGASPFQFHQWPQAGTAWSGESEIQIWMIDANGISSDTCLLPVFISDVIAPWVVNPQDTVALILSNTCDVVIPDFANWFTWQDNCSTSPTLTQTPLPGEHYYGVQSIDAAYTAIDNTGNVSIFHFNIKLTDESQPEISAPEIIALTANENCSASIGDLSSWITFSDCSSVSYYQIISDSIIALGDTAWVSIQLQDEYGNLATTDVAVTAVDYIGPWVQQVNDTTIYIPDGECQVYFFTSFFDAVDNCDPTVSLFTVNDPDMFFQAGQHTISYFAMDNAGNSSDTLQYQLTVVGSDTHWFVPLDTNYYTTCDLQFQYPQVYITNCTQQLIPAVDISEPLTIGTNTITFSYGIEGNQILYTYTVEVLPATMVQWSPPDSVCVSESMVDLSAITDALYIVTLEGNGINEVLTDNILNPSAYVPGTYTLTLDVMSDTCFTDIVITLTILPMPTVSFSAGYAETCGKQYTATIEFSGDNLNWIHGQNVEVNYSMGMVEIASISYGTYSIIAEATAGTCTSRDTLFVTFWQPPVTPDAGPDQTIYLLNQAVLSGLGMSEGGWWSVVSGEGVFDNFQNANTQVSQLAMGENSFVITNVNGPCSASDTVSVYVFGIEVPNGYSPNDDGVNDSFEIPGIENVEQAELSVFNRWGQLVYRAEKYINQWHAQNQDNEQLPDDTYFYELKLSTEIKQGFVVIKR